MAVPPEDLDAIAATVAQLYREAETSLVRIVAQHLAGDLDSDMQSPAWVERKLAAVRTLRKSARAVIAGLQAASAGSVREAAAEAFRAGWSSALAELPAKWFPASGLGPASAEAVEQLPGFAAVEALAAAVHTDIGDRSRNILRDVLDVYRNVITATVARTLTGTQPRRHASQAAWAALRKRGITGFTDRGGKRWQLSTYVEMAVRTVTQRAAVAGQTDRLAAAGVDLVYVSDSVQECELCRPFEGKILRLGPGSTGDVQVQHQLTDEPVTVHIVATLAEAQLLGLFHPNCRHSISAYLPGVTRLPAQPTADPEGDKARQQQRAIERAIRKAKTDQAAALDNAEDKRAGVKVRALQARMREHLDANPGLKRLPYREQIGAGNIPRRGDDAAGGIGPDVQPTLDGADAVQLSRSPLIEGQAPAEVPTIEPDPDQMTLDDIEDQAEPIDLATLDDDRLDELFAELSESGDDDTLDAVLAEMDRRQAEHVTEAAQPASVTWLDELFAEKAPTAPEDEQADDEPVEHAEEWTEFDALVAAGVDEREAYAQAFDKDADKIRREEAIVRLRDEGHRGRGFDELARSAYRERLQQDYFAAESATNGYLLTREGQARGLDPLDLWRNNEVYARKWASDELKEWWDDHGRLTYDQFSEQLLSGQSGQKFRTGGETWLR